MTQRPLSYRARFDDGHREELFLPPHSSYLYEQAQTINGQFETPIFYPLFHATGEFDAKGRPVYLLADEVAYDKDILDKLDPANPDVAENRARMPFIATLYDAVLSKADHGYIPIEDIKQGKNPALLVLCATWVIFNQEPNSQDEPTLTAQIVKGTEELFIAGPIITGVDELYNIHSNYFLASPLDEQKGGCELHALYIDDEDYLEALETMQQAGREISNLMELPPPHTVDAAGLHILEHDKLGFATDGISVRDRDGISHHLHGYHSCDERTITLAIFGIVRPSQPDMRVLYMNTDVDTVGVTVRGAQSVPHLFSPMLQDITRTLLDNGTWPQRERTTTMGQYLLRGARRLLGYKI